MMTLIYLFRFSYGLSPSTRFDDGLAAITRQIRTHSSLFRAIRVKTHTASAQQHAITNLFIFSSFRSRFIPSHAFYHHHRVLVCASFYLINFVDIKNLVVEDNLCRAR
jgi:hypothetical protein